MTDRPRVAVLARAGQARDQLRRALEEAGAEIVAEGDPAELDPRDVSEKLPTIFLVGLEPATEKSIDRFDALLSADGVEVMFDDAEVTGKLDGWDLNRWARHLVGKLLGGESLPPAPEGALAIGEGQDLRHDAGTLLQPGLPPTPAELMDGARLEDYTADSPELADWVPTSPSLAPKADGEDTAADAGGFSWDGSQSGTEADGEAQEFKLDTDLGIDVDLASLDFAPTPDSPPPATPARLEDEPIFQEMEIGGNVRFSTFEEDATGSEQTGDLDADVAALAAQLEAFEKADTRAAPVDPEFARAAPKEGKPEPARPEPGKGATAAPAKGAPKAAEKVAPKNPEAPAARVVDSDGNIDFSNLSLSPLDELEKAAPIEVKFSKTAAEAPAPKPSAFGDLSLEGEVAPTLSAPKATAAAAAPGDGAVLILAGLGGPDAVRQLLSSLPDSLSVPVLLYQHLEVGKHERLVEQLAKISKMPVALARENEVPVPGRVTLLPAGMTAVTQGEGLKFTIGSLSQLITALSPSDSMVIVLSGADAQLVPMILAVKEEGGVVLAQDPELCFDATASEAMRKEGAPVFPALGLARQVASRWPQ